MEHRGFTGYQGVAARELSRLGREDVPPALVEALMRGEWGTLDARPRSDFRRFARIATEAWDVEPDTCRGIVESYGLEVRS